MSLQKRLTQSLWRSGLWIVGLIGVWQSTVAQNVAAQSHVDMSVGRQSGGWQPTVKAAEVQTAYFQAQGNLSGGMPVLPTAGPGMPPGNDNYADNRNAGQLPAFPGGGDMPRAVSPPAIVSPPATMYPPAAMSPPNSRPASMADNLAPPQLPMAQPRSSNGVPARLASTELRTIENGRDFQSGTQGSNGSGLRQSGAQPGVSGSPASGRLAADSFTSGLPYVTPAPRGRYATSPYQPAVFQSSDQRPMQVPAQFASSSSVMPPNSAATQGLRQTAPPSNLIATQATMPNYVGAAPPVYLTAQQAALPQYRYPQPGVYPTAYQCTPPGPSFPSTGAVPGGSIPPTLPPNLTPNLYTPNNAGYRPLFSLGQENYNVQLGRGIIGQPTAYVSGQHIRNFLRYLSP